MKKTILSLLTVAGMAVALTFNAAAQEAKEVTIKGKGMCGKCEMKKVDSCQNVIKTKEGDKEVVYWLEQNPVAKAFHKNLCATTADVIAVGTVKTEGDKKILVAKKIDLAKKD